MSGDTWGISGPVFLLAYVLLVAGVTVAVVRTRRALAAGPARPPDGLAQRPYDVAYLNDGAHLALCAALSAMRRGGTVVPAGRGAVVAAGRPDPRAEDLERAARRAAAAPVARAHLVRDGAVAAALGRIEGRLVEAGLLVSPDARCRMRRAAGWLFAVAGLGAVRVVAGIGNGRPVGFLVVLVAATAILAVVQRGAVPRRTRAGDAALRRLRDEHHVLSPTLTPDWTAYGPSAAALGVGVFGLGALWASDPAFADELALQRAAAASGSVGDTGGVTSSCSSGSSCGGGGGCGGGGCGG